MYPCSKIGFEQARTGLHGRVGRTHPIGHGWRFTDEAVLIRERADSGPTAYDLGADNLHGLDELRRVPVLLDLHGYHLLSANSRYPWPTCAMQAIMQA